LKFIREHIPDPAERRCSGRFILCPSIPKLTEQLNSKKEDKNENNEVAARVAIRKDLLETVESKLTREARRLGD
jgi:hypothetical protein